MYINGKQACSRCRSVKGELRKHKRTTFTHSENICDRCRERDKTKMRDLVFKAAQQFKTPLKSVYAFKDKNGEVLYVGHSANTPLRIRQHYNTRKGSATAFKDIAPIYRKAHFSWEILWSGDNDLKRAMKEKEYIQKLQPKYNINSKKID